MVTTKKTYDKDQWYTLTPKDEVDRCLNCEKPRCVDCIGREARCQNSKRKFKDIDAEEFIEMYNSGESILSMAEKLGVDRRLLWRRLITLKAEYKPGRKRRVLTVEDIRRLPEWMQHYFTLKGEKMA